MKFITREELQRIVEKEDVDALNEILSRVHNSAVESVIKQIPEVISRLMVSTQAHKKMISDFYQHNKEFESHKEIVSKVVQDIECDNPEKNYEDILKLAEPIIKQKIAGESLSKGLPLDKPEKVSLDGNGVL